MTRYSSNFFLSPSILKHYLFPYLSLKMNNNNKILSFFGKHCKSYSNSQTNFAVLPEIRPQEIKVLKFRTSKINYGGSPSPIFSYNFLEPFFFNTDKSKFDSLTKFQYVDHVEVVGSQAYCEGEYI